ncbi:hypothetical protein KDW36_16305 [Burkholderia dolosa]|uniref:hypothetical protein n=1 Tax=Burkholderia dolosa TaxID=152500 RepID=UPI001B999946|nr:hypothetical protein [Burkholderia dolosa]MBR8314748.1 hypothetical protein [Burkholderia dolosa]
MWASLNVEVDEGIVHLFGKYGGRRSRERTARRSRNSRKPLDKRAALRCARSGGSRFAPRRAARRRNARSFAVSTTGRINPPGIARASFESGRRPESMRAKL